MRSDAVDFPRSFGEAHKRQRPNAPSLPHSPPDRAPPAGSSWTPERPGLCRPHPLHERWLLQYLRSVEWAPSNPRHALRTALHRVLMSEI
ncbi:hypothetical protein B0H10DRAFT_643237 [Mycena sp. CBHHK59/15]|nr:hypothetical protein B0H10DRAFT_643237 [Mycena sp. CBHHK59/15]